MEGVYLCWLLLLRLISAGRCRGQVELFATDRRLPVIGQRKIETPAGALAHMTRTGDSHSAGPLSRATHQLRLFHDVYEVAAIAFLSPPARLPHPFPPMT